MSSPSNKCDYCRDIATTVKYRALQPGVASPQKFCTMHQDIIDEYDRDTPEDALTYLVTRKLLRNNP